MPWLDWIVKLFINNDVTEEKCLLQLNEIKHDLNARLQDVDDIIKIINCKQLDKSMRNKLLEDKLNGI